MKTSFKKLMAGVTLVTLVAMNAASLIVNAAAINNATAAVTAGVGIVITGTGFPVGGTCDATITRTNNNGTTTNVSVTSCTQTNATTLTIAAATVAVNEYYTIAFSATNGVFGTATAGDTTNSVAVSARVLPILSMDISNSAVNLGVLTPGAINDSATDTTVTVKTNAVNGYIVQAAATNFTDGSHTIPFVTRAAQAAGTSGFSIDVASVGQGTNGTSTVASANGLGGASTFAVANGAATIAGAVSGIGTAGTTDGDTVVVNYAAAVSAVQEAGSYANTVTYTTSGTF